MFHFGSLVVMWRRVLKNHNMIRLLFNSLMRQLMPSKSLHYDYVIKSYSWVDCQLGLIALSLAQLGPSLFELFVNFCSHKLWDAAKSLHNCCQPCFYNHLILTTRFISLFYFMFSFANLILASYKSSTIRNKVSNISHSRTC